MSSSKIRFWEGFFLKSYQIVIDKYSSRAVQLLRPTTALTARPSFFRQTAQTEQLKPLFPAA